MITLLSLYLFIIFDPTSVISCSDNVDLYHSTSFCIIERAVKEVLKFVSSINSKDFSNISLSESENSSGGFWTFIVISYSKSSINFYHCYQSINGFVYSNSQIDSENKSHTVIYFGSSSSSSSGSSSISSPSP